MLLRVMTQKYPALVRSSRSVGVGKSVILEFSDVDAREVLEIECNGELIVVTLDDS